MPGHRVGVVGAGYVGLTTAVCLAALGHQVVCVDVDRQKIAELREGRVCAHEPRLAELAADGVGAGRLAFTTGLADAAAVADVLFLCLPTPMAEDGTADLGALRRVLAEAAAMVPRGCVLVVKSTVPVGTTRWVAQCLDRPDLAVVCNPEFLREGHAVADFLHPARIILGSDSPAGSARVRELYARLDAPALLTDPVSAELVKYGSNWFLAMKLSYVNVLAELCERFGADIADVATGLRQDPRIGGSCLAPGPGWGGSCLPKDTQALAQSARAAGVEVPLLHATIDANTRQRDRVVGKVRQAVSGNPGGSLRGVRVGLLGLTFKAGTDDLRDSPALAVAELLAAAGGELTGYDPCVPATGDRRTGPVRVVDDPYLAAKDAEVVVLLTEWPQFWALDWAQLGETVRRRAVVDTRNHLDVAALRAAGFDYYGIGR